VCKRKREGEREKRGPKERKETKKGYELECDGPTRDRKQLVSGQTIKDPLEFGLLCNI
jgi:hypothetical protein